MLVFSTHDFAESRKEAFETGAADYLVKPADIGHVLSAVERLCGNPHPASPA